MSRPFPYITEEGSPAEMPSAEHRNMAERNAAKGYYTAVKNAVSGSFTEFFATV